MHELKDIQSFSDEWLQLNNKFELEKSSLDRKLFTQKFYEDFIKNSKSMNLINDLKRTPITKSLNVCVF